MKQEHENPTKEIQGEVIVDMLKAHNNRKEEFWAFCNEQECIPGVDIEQYIKSTTDLEKLAELLIEYFAYYALMPKEVCADPDARGMNNLRTLIAIANLSSKKLLDLIAMWGVDAEMCQQVLQIADQSTQTLSAIVRTYPEAFSKVARGRVYWPLEYSPVKALFDKHNDFLSKLELGHFFDFSNVKNWSLIKWLALELLQKIEQMRNDESTVNGNRVVWPYWYLEIELGVFNQCNVDAWKRVVGEHFDLYYGTALYRQVAFLKSKLAKKYLIEHNRSLHEKHLPRSQLTNDEIKKLRKRLARNTTKTKVEAQFNQPLKDELQKMMTIFPCILEKPRVVSYCNENLVNETQTPNSLYYSIRKKVLEEVERLAPKRVIEQK